MGEGEEGRQGPGGEGKEEKRKRWKHSNSRRKREKEEGGGKEKGALQGHPERGSWDCVQIWSPLHRRKSIWGGLEGVGGNGAQNTSQLLDPLCGATHTLRVRTTHTFS